MATQFSDMALGGESGFAAGYTPIRFAPLVSLTGPITAPAPPAAPEAPVAPMVRPPVYQGDAGDYGGMPHTYAGGPPVGERSREALKADLANAVGFFTNPFGMLADYVLTGQTPAMRFGIGDQREALGLQQSDIMPQGILPQGGTRDWLTGARKSLFGPQQPSVQLPYESGKYLSIENDGSMIGAVINDTKSVAESWGLSPDQTQNAVAAAANMFAQGTDAATAVTMALMNASMAATQMDMAGSPFGQPATQGAAPQGTVVAAPAQTFGIRQGGQIASIPISGGESMGSYGEGSFTGGGWSPGDVAGAYSDITGYE